MASGANGAAEVTVGKIIRERDPHVLVGAIVGIAAALAFIGWVLSKL